MGATGISTAVLSGAFEIRRIWIWVAWFAAIIWVCSNLYIYLHRADRSRIQPVLRFDAWWRAILLVVAAGAAIAALLGAGIASDTALALKLLLFALAVALSLVLRALFKPIAPRSRELRQEATTPSSPQSWLRRLHARDPLCS